MALWEEILRHPLQLADAYECLWKEQLVDPRAFYDDVRRRFNESGEPALLLYLLARCVKAAVRYSRSGLFNQSPDNRRLGAKPEAMRKRILLTSATLEGATLSSGDYRNFLLSARKEDVVYMDPPYQGVSSARDHRYVRGLDRLEFQEALVAAIDIDASFIVSYDVVSAERRYGGALEERLGLTHLHILAGRSSQATLQGINRSTVESIYLSPALVARLQCSRLDELLMVE